MEDHPVPKALLFLCPVYGDIPSRLSIEGNREYRSLALRSKSWYNGYIGPYNTRQGLSPAIQCTSQIEWCRRWDSNPHEVYPQRFLRPSRLPFRHFGTAVFPVATHNLCFLERTVGSIADSRLLVKS